MGVDLPKTSVSVLACDRPELLKRTLDSIGLQRAQIEYHHAVNVKSAVRGVQNELEARRKGEYPIVITRVEYRGESHARNHCLDLVAAQGIDLGMWCDDDDTYGPGFVESMRHEWIRLKKPDILVPDEWARQWGLDGVLEQFHSTIPTRLDDFEGWARLFQIGAACGISIGAYHKFGGFDETQPGDPWIRMYYGWILQGARVELAHTKFDRSYIWLQHGVPDVHDRIRHYNSRLRVPLVQSLYEAHMAGARPSVLVA